MSLVFHKEPIELCAKTLQSLLDKFASYTSEVRASGDDEEMYEEYISTINPQLGSIDTIKMSRNSLQELIDLLRKEFEVAKSKKKDLVSEVEEIKKETKFNEKIANANEMIFILGTRITEAKNLMSKLARKLGKARVDVENACRTVPASREDHWPLTETQGKGQGGCEIMSHSKARANETPAFLWKRRGVPRILGRLRYSGASE